MSKETTKPAVKKAVKTSTPAVKPMVAKTPATKPVAAKKGAGGTKKGGGKKAGK